MANIYLVLCFSIAVGTSAARRLVQQIMLTMSIETAAKGGVGPSRDYWALNSINKC